MFFIAPVAAVLDIFPTRFCHLSERLKLGRQGERGHAVTHYGFYRQARARPWFILNSKLGGRQGLHATFLQFPHPRAGEEMKFSSPILPDRPASGAWPQAFFRQAIRHPLTTTARSPRPTRRT